MARPTAPANSLADLAELREALRDRAARERLAAERRRLDDAERERAARLFSDAVAGARPLRPQGRMHAPAPALEPIAHQRHRDEMAVLAESISDEIDIERLLDTDENLSYRRTGIDPNAVRRLRRGDWAITAQIDLHGLRVDEARIALSEFLTRAIREERRCVRVIHGKGLGSVNRQPVLKSKVMKWLIQRADVQAFCQARPNDGGSGALVVLLRGPRRAGDDPRRRVA